MIQNASSKPFLFVQLLFLSLARLLGKRVICYAQGVGPVNGIISRLCMRLVLSRLDLITLRDRASAERLAQMGMDPTALRVSADPSFCVEMSSGPEVDHLLHSLGVRCPFVAIAVRRWGHYRGGWLPVRLSRKRLSAEHEGSYAKFCRDVAAAADYCCEALAMDVLFVPMCPEGDQQDDQVATAIKALMAHKQQAAVLDRVLPSAQLKGLLGQAELVLAMRTHAGMLAADAGVPVASLSYQGKGEAFMAAAGLVRYVLPVEQCNRDSLQDLVVRTWRDRASIRRQLQISLPHLRELAWHNIELVATMMEGAECDRGLTDKWTARDAGRWARLTGGEGRKTDALLPRRFSAVLSTRQQYCLKLASIRQGDTVLDVGCGVGYYRRPVVDKGATWVGLDASRELLFYARSEDHETATLAQGDVMRLPVSDAAFSVLLCIGVLDYLPAGELPHALEEMTRVLQPDGRLVFTCNGAWWGESLRRGPLSLLLPGAWRHRRTCGHGNRLRALLPQTKLVLAAERRMSGGLLGPDTYIFLLQKEAQPCALEATTGQSSLRI